MLATPNGNEIVFQHVPNDLQTALRTEFKSAKHQYGDFEAAVIRIPDGEFNLQIHQSPSKTFLTERIGSDSAVADFRRIVREQLG